MLFQTLFEGRWIFAVLAAATALTWFFAPWLSLIFLLLIFYTVAFFRDPNRIAPADANAIVAAADGKVTDIIEVEEAEVHKTNTRRIEIFLSIFDFHTNRAPIDGLVIYRKHRVGLFMYVLRLEYSE